VCLRGPVLCREDRERHAALAGLKSSPRDQDAGGDATNRLLRAVTSNRVKIAISDAVVDEPLPLLAQSIAIGARHLALLLSLADWKKGVVKMPKDLVRDEALAARDGKGRPTSFRRIPGWMAQSGVLDGLYVVKTDHRRHGGGPQKEDEAGTHFQKGVLHIRHIRDRALELLQ
jgi:hypothetical protein